MEKRRVKKCVYTRTCIESPHFDTGSVTPGGHPRVKVRTSSLPRQRRCRQYTERETVCHRTFHRDSRACRGSRSPSRSNTSLSGQCRSPGDRLGEVCAHAPTRPCPRGRCERTNCTRPGLRRLSTPGKKQYKHAAISKQVITSPHLLSLQSIGVHADGSTSPPVAGYPTPQLKMNSGYVLPGLCAVVLHPCTHSTHSTVSGGVPL